MGKLLFLLVYESMEYRTPLGIFETEDEAIEAFRFMCPDEDFEDSMEIQTLVKGKLITKARRETRETIAKPIT